MLRKTTALLASVCVFALVAASTAAGQEGFSGDKTRDQWKNDLAVYLWMVNMDADLTVGTTQVPLEASFGDLWDILKFAASAHYEGRKGAWGLMLDGSYSNLGEDDIAVIEGPGDLLPTLLTANYRWKIYRGEAAVLFSPLDLGPQRLDFMGGVRYTKQDLTLSFETPLPIEPEDRGFDESWIDPFLGVRWGIGFGQYNRWLFWIRTDLGGFGISSDLAFNAAANFGFRISRVVSVSLGGRYMYTDYTSGTIDTDDYFAYKGDESGLLLGLGFRF
jgi:hypothetical protein